MQLNDEYIKQVRFVKCLTLGIYCCIETQNWERYDLHGVSFFLSAPPPRPTPYFFTYHVFYLLFRFYTICLSLSCSDDVDMTDPPPPHTTSAAPETKQSWRRWRSHIPLSPVEQPRLPFFFIYLFIFFSYLLYRLIYMLFASTISKCQNSIIP